ncbi:MAG: hypothetical protein Alpg2KO_15500 [Alphaproteobacteria bacterium]
MLHPRMLAVMAIAAALPTAVIAQSETSILETAKPVAYGYEEDTPFRPQLLKLFEPILEENQDSRAGSNLGVATIDINAYGATEVVARLESIDTCGSGGCQTHVYQYTSAGWAEIFNAWVQSVAVAESETGGYKDLVINGNRIWRWNGTSYDLSE